MSVTDAQWEAGLKVVDQVYGAGFSEMMRPYRNDPLNQEIVCNQFGKIWADAAFTIREKRLMVLGATTMLGRADLIETQMLGAIRNREFTDEQLEQIPRFLLSYAGAGNATALFRSIEAARMKHRAEAP